MPRTVNLAAVQMDAYPASTPERLARADKLVREAADAGAQLILLPELFHLGYTYDDSNFDRAESLHGPSATWMRDLAMGLDIHLAGSILLRDGAEIYNSLLLFAPSGQMWRYDKNFPWGWERGYFIGRRNITVADTALGKIGMLICWDAAHASLWREYAGKVDLMLVSSCPPDVGNAAYRFPSGATMTLTEAGSTLGPLHDSADRNFGTMNDQQTAWLGAPTVAAVGSGMIDTEIPRGKATWAAMVPLAPKMARFYNEADGLEMLCPTTAGTKVLDASGTIVSELAAEAGESWTMAEVTLADVTPTPRGPQPEPPVPASAFLVSDVLLPALMRKVYRRGNPATIAGKSFALPRLALVGGLAALLVWAIQRIRSRQRAELPLERLGEVIEHAIGAIRRPD